MLKFSSYMMGKVIALRRKYSSRGFENLSSVLSNIVWYSFPIVYPEFWSDVRVASKNRDKVKARRKRYRKYIRGLVGDTIFTDDTVYLVSLTFDDDTLSSTSRSTRDRYVKNYLNSFCTDYFACLDFGRKNGREHYHAIVSTSEPMIAERHRRKVFYKVAEPKKQWHYGFYSFRAITTDEKNIYKTANYALKSSDYAFKSADEDNGVKPFHKRNVQHCVLVDDLNSLSCDYNISP